MRPAVAVVAFSPENDLRSKNRRLEKYFQFVLQNKSRAVEAVLDLQALAGACES